ncbi:MAG TPA: xanthine dehydrogenase family protein subunit M [Chloroflexota bacterium]|nr:xanthine dehydrogenase family protein subunit M [Chloroflexota bacterium]
MIDFDYQAPAQLDEALALLQQHGDDARVIAGGTALVIMMKQRLVQPQLLVSLRRIPELEQVRADNGTLHLGATATHRAVETSPIVRDRWPLLAETYRHVATVRIRNMATVGGGVVHGDPNQDPPPALIALDAKARLRSASGEREVPLQSFFLDYYETDVQPGEVLTEIVVPEQPRDAGWSWVKFLPRTADDYATVSVACLLSLENGSNRCREARIALGSAATTPVRADAAENALRGQELTPERLREAAQLVAGQVDPISDFRGSSDYKRDMAVVWTRRALEQALQRAKGSA